MSLRHLNYEDDDEDSAVTYGTPFPPSLEDTNAPKKAEVDLTVRDEQGRRRFHGAFTGGFSAGYFNTVGSKEGWVPAQFKSSRQSGKWSRDLVKGKPEDYMDDEDLNVFGITPRTVQTTDQFSGDVTRALFAGFRDPSTSTKSLSQVLEDIIKPVKLSVGLKLYKKMKRPKSKPETETIETEAQSSSSKVYGCILPPGLRPDGDEEEDEDDPTFSMESYVLPFDPKDNFHGLGYQGINKENPLIDPTAASVSGNFGGRKLKITGEAFGIGALSDEDDLDEDAVVYGTDDLNNYDFAIGSNKQPKAKIAKSTPLLALTDSNKLADIFEPENSLTSSKQFKSSLRSRFKLPELSRHFKPRPPWTSKAASSTTKRSRWDIEAETGKKFDSDKRPSQLGASSREPKDVVRESRDQKSLKQRAPVLDANVRGLLLGEEVINIKRDGQKSDGSSTSVLERKVLFVPSNQEEEKRSRDDSCPSSINTQEEVLSTIAKPSPLFGYFASKFTHSSDPVVEAQMETKLDPGLTQASQLLSSKQSSKNAQEEEESKKEEVSVGSCSRISYQWHPHKLVSRRFNVPVAYPQFPDVVGVVLVGKYAENIRNRTSLVTQSSTSSSSTNRVSSSTSTFVPSSSVDHSKSQQRKRDGSELDESGDRMKRDVKALNEIPLPELNSEVRSFQNEKNLFQTSNEMEEDPVHASINTSRFITSEGKEDQMVEEREETRPPIDLFRAIFASDEEKDTDVEDEEETEGKDESHKEYRDKKGDLMEKTSGESRSVHEEEKEDSRVGRRRDRDDVRLDWKKDSSSSHYHHPSRPFGEADDPKERRKRRDGSERKERDSSSHRHEKEERRKRNENRSECRNDHDPRRDGWGLLNETTRSDQTYESEGKREDWSKTRDRRGEVKSSDEGWGSSNRGKKNRWEKEDKNQIEGGRNVSGNESMNSSVSSPSAQFSSSNFVEESFSRPSSSIGTSKLHSFIRQEVKELSSSTTLCDTISVTNVASSLKGAKKNLNKQEKEEEGHQGSKGRWEAGEMSLEASTRRTSGERSGDMNDTGLNDRLSSPATRSTGPFEQRAKEDVALTKRGPVAVSHGEAGTEPADTITASRMKGHLHNLGAESSTLIRSQVSSRVTPTEISGFNEANLCEDGIEYGTEEELYGPSLPPPSTLSEVSASDHNSVPLDTDLKQKWVGEDRSRKRAPSDLVTVNCDHMRKDRSKRRSKSSSSIEEGMSQKRKKGRYKKKRKRSKDSKKDEIKKMSKKHHLKDVKEGDGGRIGKSGSESDFRSKKLGMDKRKKSKRLKKDEREKVVKKRKDSKKKHKKSSTSSSDSSTSDSSSSPSSDEDSNDDRNREKRCSNTSAKNKFDEEDLKLLKLLREGKV